MKKLFSLILAALMLICALPVSAADAVDTITATASDNVEVGEEFTVALNYTAVNGFGGIAFSVEFDADALKLVEVDTANAICTMTATPVDDVTDTVSFSYAGLTNVTASGKIAVLTFTVLEDAPRGETEITVSVPDGEPFYYEGQTMVDLTVDTVGDTVMIPLRDFEGLSMADATYTYDGTEKSLAVAGTLPADADVEYEGNAQTAVGTYTVKATVSCDEYNDKELTATITIEAAELTLTALDVENKTFDFDGDVDGDDVTLDFDKITVAKDGDKWVASGFELTGEDKDNYTLATETFEVEVAEENIVTVTVVSEYEEADSTTEEFEFYNGATASVTADGAGTKYKFAGWYVDGEKVSADKEYTFTAENDFEITAKYEKKSDTSAIAAAIAAANRKCEVRFDTIAGSRVATQSVKKGDKVQRPADPTKSGYTFAGWYTNTAYTTEYDFSAAVSGDMTLYAKWELVDRRIIMTIDSTDATVFGKATTTDVAPIIVNDRTMLPSRFVAENLGATVAWDAEARKATIVGNGVTIELIIDSDIAYVNGEAVTLDSPAFIRNDRTYTPVRFIAEALGATVEWDAATRQAIITK